MGADPPDRVERHVATLVSRLRGVLGPDTIGRDEGGYRFRPSVRFQFDADEADALVTEAEARLAAGEPALAWTACEQALGFLERGELLEDEPYADWLANARAAVAGLVRRNRHAAWQAALALGERWRWRCSKPSGRSPPRAWSWP